MFLKAIGLLMVGIVVAAGVKWLYDNVTFKKTQEKYTYRADGTVLDHTEIEKGNK